MIPWLMLRSYVRLFCKWIGRARGRRDHLDAFAHLHALAYQMAAVTMSAARVSSAKVRALCLRRAG